MLVRIGGAGCSHQVVNYLAAGPCPTRSGSPCHRTPQAAQTDFTPYWDIRGIVVADRRLVVGGSVAAAGSVGSLVLIRHCLGCGPEGL